jgi:hypothetical protein
MSYVKCERCGLTAFSAAYRFTVDYCPRCGERLPHPRSAFEPARETLRVPAKTPVPTPTEGPRHPA